MNKKKKEKKQEGPRVLLIDIETSPLLSYTWGIWNENIGLNQIEKDWGVLSWCAKWLGDPESKVMYMDQSKADDIENDEKIVKAIWKLLNEADIVIGHNSKRFDVKKLNTKFVLYNLDPPSRFKQIDTLSIAKKHFVFTSNKLEFLTNILCKKYKKLKHKKFPGFELWRECLLGNQEAWDEMKKYNINDVLSLEELFNALKEWDKTLNFNIMPDNGVCKCGSTNIKKNGFDYTKTTQFQRWKCKNCARETRSEENLLDLSKKKVD